MARHVAGLVNGLLGAALCALIVTTTQAGCSGCHSPPPPLQNTVKTTTTDNPRTVTNEPRTVTNEDRLGAMMSVHARAYHKAGYLPFTAEELDLPSFRRIVAILTEDRDPFAASRRRRAIAQLAAYGGDEETGRGSWETATFKTTWQQLLSYNPADTYLIDRVLQDLRVKEAPKALEARIYDTLAPLVPECVTKNPVFNPPVWQTTGEVDVKLEITVENTATDVVSQRIDPQNWAHCPKGDLFFANSYLTTDKPSPTTVCPIPNPPTPADPNANDGKPLGSKYDAKLFEDFVCVSCTAEYKNLLSIHTVLTDKPCGDGINTCDNTGSFSPANPVPYEACYTLERGEQALVGCIDSALVHLTADQGDLTACQASSDTRVVSRKTIKFEETILNATYYYALLWVGQVEATQMLAEVVCCIPPSL